MLDKLAHEKLDQLWHQRERMSGPRGQPVVELCSRLRGLRATLQEIDTSVISDSALAPKMIRAAGITRKHRRHLLDRVIGEYAVEGRGVPAGHCRPSARALDRTTNARPGWSSLGRSADSPET